jgi:hypothetical protein
MKAAEFRANAAGYLDSATMLTRTVIEALRAGEQMTDETGRRQKIACPSALYDQLMDAEKLLQRVAGWLLDPTNARLES